MQAPRRYNNAGGKCIFTALDIKIFLLDRIKTSLLCHVEAHKREQSRVEDEATRCKNLNRKSDSKLDNRRICEGSFRIKRLVD